MQSNAKMLGRAKGEAIPFAQRLSCSIDEAVQVTGLGRSTLYNRIADGQLSTKTVGRRRLVSVPSLLALVGAASDQPPATEPRATLPGDEVVDTVVPR